MNAELTDMYLVKNLTSLYIIQDVTIQEFSNIIFRFGQKDNSAKLTNREAEIRIAINL